jgi:hypothetical protein
VAQKKGTEANEAPPAQEEERKTCGIIMPISATSTHEAHHWGRVQQLLHRGVEQAGLEPKNVWAGSSIDRITPRILGNLFGFPIALCDISDLNPNVMLELGMRLTSKKPTVVVAEKGSTIPFDIRDFEAIFYPSDLNILDMEVFFEELSFQLQSKLAAYENGTYDAFLKDIGPIDVLEPESKAVPFQQLVESRLDTIMSRIDQITRTPAAMRKQANALGVLYPDTNTFRNVRVETTTYKILVKSESPSASSSRISAALMRHPAVVGMENVDDGVVATLDLPVSVPTMTGVKEWLEAHGIIADVRAYID